MKIKILFVLVLLGLFSCSKNKSLLIQTASTIKILETDSNDSILIKAAYVVPTPNQYEALKNEFIAFIHFGPNTFTRMEWGNGMEDPKLFNLKNLDTDQWCKAMKAAGMKMVIITVKHHDGFVLWQSRYTKHGIMSSPYKNGEGDILKELAESIKKYDLKLGVYLSPADLFQIENQSGLYGNLSQYTNRTIPRIVEGRPFTNKTTFTFKVDDYNEYFLNQLFELLTEYGPIHEVWFDGAHPKRKGGQTYNYIAWKELIHKLAPKAVIFGKQDIRWCGNEAGRTRDTEWNVIPYLEDPAAMNRFGDLTADSLGHPEQLYKGAYLHYQQAETNTSIREGWFYRDDTDQKVRNTDDVFDMYERAVGGNSTFLLNIPPNREGKFSAKDVQVLEEVGQRIEETYSKNLFNGAAGPSNVLDRNMTSYELLDKNEIVISLKLPITINRLVLQEAITTHSERVAKHAVDAWVHNGWEEITTATNIGYKRILRFSEVTSNKFRIRILESRLPPAITNITAHYYSSRPPQLSISRNKDGALKIEPKKHTFRWKPHGENVVNNLNSNYEIRYTTDGSTPSKTSTLFTDTVLIEGKQVKAVAIDKEHIGAIASTVFGMLKKGLKIKATNSETDKHIANMAIDEDPNTYWQSKDAKGAHFIQIDLGEEVTLKGFAYTPQTEHTDGMIEEGLVQISADGTSWEVAEAFKFGNLINDPTKRKHYFMKPLQTRYVKIVTTSISGGKNSAAMAEIDFFKY